MFHRRGCEPGRDGINCSTGIIFPVSHEGYRLAGVAVNSSREGGELASAVAVLTNCPEAGTDEVRPDRVG
jgi:hypothetical protein